MTLFLKSISNGLVALLPHTPDSDVGGHNSKERLARGGLGPESSQPDLGERPKRRRTRNRDE